MAQGKICVLDIDMQVGVLSYCYMIGYAHFSKGVRSLKKTDLNPVFVLVKPPSLEILVSSVQWCYHNEHACNDNASQPAACIPYTAKHLRGKLSRLE